ncbi:hypothetical protein [Clostridium cylindrosporum]|uniref:Uncharacterized protein n=1 Tax=Clostridium cylindrosporum DSM 605 TaxID=1121307 RepID=A0A0J8G4X2_CLOCY|nr:hypothetical protein [Clostridium cylindrosporum]KMT22721.1 hypothetical protein CLCY_11c00550 [Clostridium cylindrosporum DSM 605]
MAIIKKQGFILKVALIFIFTFVSLAGYSLDLKNSTVYSDASAKSRSSSGGFKSSSFKSSSSSSSSWFSSKPKSSSNSSGFKSGGFKSSGGSSSKGYNSGSFKSTKDGSSSGYGSGSFKESKTPKVDSTPKTDTSKNYKKGSSSAYPVPIPIGGYSPFGFRTIGSYYMMKYIVSAIVITIIVIALYLIYRKMRNRRH